jgi:hypothetical protein
MDYKEKYLKYKSKYLKLKKMSGGTFICNYCRGFNRMTSATCTLCNSAVSDFQNMNSILKYNNANGDIVPYATVNAPANTLYVNKIYNNRRNRWDFNPANVQITFEQVLALPDYTNLALISYIGTPLFGNSINVYAITYRFGDASGNMGAIDVHSERHTNRITISYAQPFPQYRDLIEYIRLQNRGRVPPDIYLLGTVYTVDKFNPYGPFLDVQLCTGGGINLGESPLQAGRREAVEECGLITNVLHLNTISTIPRLSTYFVNADIAGNVSLNPPPPPPPPVPAPAPPPRIGTVHVMIYGSLATLQGLVHSIVNRTDLNDIQGIALVKLT